MTSTASPSLHFGVLLHNMDRVDAALCGLNKRAERKGLPLLAWTWAKPVTTRERIPHPDYGWEVEFHGNVTRVPLLLSDNAIRYDGWTFVAALQHLDGENIVRALPGEEVPALYRERGPACDHCAARRRRNDTYLVRHDDGSIKQVGSTCMGDFLGRFDAISLACRASMLADARAIAEDGMEGMGCGGGERTRTLVDYLPIVAWFVRDTTYGWVPRSKASDVGCPATADLAWIVMVNSSEARKVGVDVTEEDKSTAAAAEAWAESLSDATVDAERGDYLHNLRAVARTGLVTARTDGIAASMIVAYQRHVARERELAESAQRVRVDAFVGTVKQRVTFGLPQEVGKKGKPLKGSPIVLSADPVWLEAVIGYESSFGYTTVVKFRSAEGHLLVWKSHDTGLTRADVGKRYTLSGTIKVHSLYTDVKQTVLTRCEAVSVDADLAATTESSEAPEPLPVAVGAAVIVLIGTYERRGIVTDVEADRVGVILEPENHVTWLTSAGARRFRIAPQSPYAVGAQVTSKLFGANGVVTDTNAYDHCRIRLDGEPMGSWHTPEAAAACFTLVISPEETAAA